MANPYWLVRGTLDTLVLRALSSAPLHGFEISEWLETQSKHVLDVDDSALYQAVYRLNDYSPAWRLRSARVVSRGRRTVCNYLILR
ncbi:MAG: hypothetical protein ABJB74_06865 [Gemmatimonas sp.]